MFQAQESKGDRHQRDVVVPVGIDATRLNLHNTYHWTKQAFAQGNMGADSARINRWAEGANGGARPVVASTKMPLVNRVWETYPGMPWGYAGDSGTPSQTTQVQPDGSELSTWATVNSAGRIVTMQDSVGRTTTYIYAQNGQDLLQVWHAADGQNDLLTSIGGYVNGQPQTVTAANGTMTQISYNGRGQPSAVTNALGEQTGITYVEAANTPSFGRRSNVVAAAGTALAAATQFGYDAHGRLATVTDAQGDTVTFSYDAIGNDPLKTLDRVTVTTGPDGSGAWVLWNRLDVAEHHEFFANAAERVTTYVHDANRKVTGVTYPSGKTVSYVQGNCCGSVDTLVDSAGHQTHWEYDVLGRKTGKWLNWSAAPVQVAGYGYDATGRLQWTQDARGNVKNHAYDGEGRLAQIQHIVNDPNTQPTPDVVLSYEPTYGRLATVLDGTGTTAYSYIPVNAGDGILGDGALGTETKIAGNAVQYTNSYTYDALGRRVSGPRQGSAQWDALGRLTAATSGLGAFAFGYEGISGRLSQADTTLTDAAVALRASFTYEGANTERRLTGIIHQRGDGAGGWNVFAQHGYTYDPQGRLASWQQWSADAQRTWNLTHDGDDQLASVDESGTGGADTPGAFGYGYDLGGNRTSATTRGVNRQWSANGLNQLVQQTAGPENGTAFNYDADGNLLNDGVRTYQWDAENRLLGMSGSFGTVAWEYDAFSRRVRQHDTPVGGAEQVRDLIWEGLSIIESRDQSTDETRRYYGNGEERLTTSTQAVTVRLYYTTDHLGSVRELVDGSGALRGRYDYSPYGERTKASGDLDGDFGFTGHYTHEASGVILAPYRVYDPTTARWFSRDPIEEAGGINLYGYVGNSPWIAIDPLGKDRVVVDTGHTKIFVQTANRDGWLKIEFGPDVTSCRNGAQVGGWLGMAKFGLKRWAWTALALMKGAVYVTSAERPNGGDSMVSSAQADQILIEFANSLSQNPPDYNTLFFNCRHFTRTFQNLGIPGAELPGFTLNPIPSVGTPSPPPRDNPFSIYNKM